VSGTLLSCPERALQRFPDRGPPTEIIGLNIPLFLKNLPGKAQRYLYSVRGCRIFGEFLVELRSLYSCQRFPKGISKNQSKKLGDTPANKHKPPLVMSKLSCVFNVMILDLY
jgi:hypothetical protein